MLRFVVLVVAVALVSGNALPPKVRKHRPDGRIIGGSLAKIEDNPWQASLEAFGIHNCGAVIISEDTLITAAHCIDALISLFYEVVTGTSDLANGGKRSSIKQAIVHEGYNGFTNDIAFIKLNEPLTFDDTTQAIPLADEDPAPGDTVVVSGWGLLNEFDLLTPNLLYSVEVQIVDRAECRADYADVEDAEVDETMVCAAVPGGGKDACSGDSGGPLVKDGVLVGLVSWGVGCALPEYPGVYTDVANLREWIKNNVCENLRFGPNILPIALPKFDENVKDGISAMVSGWGYNDKNEFPNQLQRVSLVTIDQAACRKRYQKVGNLTGRMLCAGCMKGVCDSCLGDSGGPLIAGGKLVGIVSWGYGCAENDYPGIYTKDAKFRKWIKTKIKI